MQPIATSHQTPYIHGPAIISTLERALGKPTSVTTHMYVVYVETRHTDTTAVLIVKRRPRLRLDYIKAAYPRYRVKMKIIPAFRQLIIIKVYHTRDRCIVQKRIAILERTLSHIKPFNAT